MNNPKKHQRIRVPRATNGYQPGKIYTIERIDASDNTLIAKDTSGKEGRWIKWSECVCATPDVNWEWLKGQLPGEILELLSAFNGLENLRLKNEVRDYILLQLPQLKERILQAQVALDEQFGGEPFHAAEDSPEPDPEAELEIP